MIIWYAFYNKFSTNTDFKKNHVFSLEKSLVSFKKKFPMFWEMLLFQSHSTANLLQFGDKKFSRWEPSNIQLSIGK